MAEDATVNVTVRDVPRATLEAIDRAAREAGYRSREPFLRADLERRFVTGSPTSAIAARFRAAIDELVTLGTTLSADRPPTFAAIARALQHENTAQIESVYNGEQPLSFRDGDRFCDLVGLSRRYLDDGGEAPYLQHAAFRDPGALLGATYEKGMPYDQLWFVLEDAPRGEAAVFGHRRDHSPWRIELVLSGVPMHSDVGATGQGMIRDFAFYLMLLGNTLTGHTLLCNRIPQPLFFTAGRVVDTQAFRDLLWGTIHPAGVLCKRGDSSNWYQDFADVDLLSRPHRNWAVDGTYTKNWGAAVKVFKTVLDAHGLTTGTDVVLYMYDHRLVHCRPRDGDIARLLCEGEPGLSYAQADEVIEAAKRYAAIPITKRSIEPSADRDAWRKVRSLYVGTQAITPEWLAADTHVDGCDEALETRSLRLRAERAVARPAAINVGP